MYKRLFTLLCFIGPAFAGWSQITLSVQVPSVGVIQKSQLWNMTLVFTENNSLGVYIGLVLLSARDNRPVMTATTRPIILTKGARQLKAADITPIRYNYQSAVFNVDNNPDGFLPIGNYRACYTIYKSGENSGMPLAEDCIPVEVQPLSPPLLNAPADGAIVETPYPQFTWLPPMPMNLFSNLKYQLIVAEVLPGQTSGKAIQQNMPVYNANNGNIPFNNYPASNKSLDTGRLYAWRIVVKNENDFITQSDVWTFRIREPQVQISQQDGNAYVKLEKGPEVGYIQCKGSLRFAYNNDAGDTLLQYTLTDAGEGRGNIVKTDSTPVQRGQNFIELDFLNKGNLSTGKVYLLQIINSRKETWGIKFTYNNPELSE